MLRDARHPGRAKTAADTSKPGDLETHQLVMRLGVRYSIVCPDMWCTTIRAASAKATTARKVATRISVDGPLRCTSRSPWI
jgi:hypothetical protein